jgi:formylglycine-generating enzyme required for sulfatase activity
LPADAVIQRDHSVLMTFVRLPKGTFYAGWTGKKESAKKKEILQDFEIAVHDVTQGQWQAVMGVNPSHFSRNGAGSDLVRGVSDEELKLLPVESVSWDDIQPFIKKLNEQERGRGYLYRMPTDSEWEYACRCGANSEAECSYIFYLEEPTNGLSSHEANFDGTHQAFGKPLGPYLRRPTRVGAYPPNKLGLCDMHGNVAQWISDQFNPLYSSRVNRGGGWSRVALECNATSKRTNASSYRAPDLGFRLVRVPVPLQGR